MRGIQAIIPVCLFVHCFQINAEFRRITTIPLQSRFLSQLDILSDKLVKLFKKRAGQIGTHLKTVLSPITQVRIASLLWDENCSDVCSEVNGLSDKMLLSPHPSLLRMVMVMLMLTMLMLGGSAC